MPHNIPASYITAFVIPGRLKIVVALLLILLLVILKLWYFYSRKWSRCILRYIWLCVFVVIKFPNIYTFPLAIRTNKFFHWNSVRSDSIKTEFQQKEKKVFLYAFDMRRLSILVVNECFWTVSVMKKYDAYLLF